MATAAPQVPVPQTVPAAPTVSKPTPTVAKRKVGVAKKKSNVTKIVIAIFVLLCLIGVGVGVYFLLIKKKNDSSSSSGSTAKVQFYEHCNYDGNVWSLGVGHHSTGFNAKAISSIKMPPGFTVKLYENADMTGQTKTYAYTAENKGEFPCFVQSGFNDMTAHIEITSS